MPVSPEDIARAVRTRLVEIAPDIGRWRPSEPLLDRLERFASLLALWGRRMNLTSRPDDPIQVASHIVDSLMPLRMSHEDRGKALSDAFVAGNRVLDIGTGAGFPGLVLACACDLRLHLAEARQRRASFLNVVTSELGLKNVTVDASHLTPDLLKADFEVVMARALGAPAEFYSLAMKALRPGGFAILYAGARQRLDLNSARQHGLDAHARVEYELPGAEQSNRRLLALWRRCA